MTLTAEECQAIHESLEERAAIQEYDGGEDRETAEREACAAVECPRCGGRMGKGRALVSTMTIGTPDFSGSEVVTMSPGGPGRLIDVLKCRECGQSLT